MSLFKAARVGLVETEASRIRHVTVTSHGPFRALKTSSRKYSLRPRNVERTYTGPEPESIPAPRDAKQAENYYATVGNESILSHKWSKALGIGGWVVGAFACAYMALFADFGDHEHVFQPLRRQYRKLMNEMVTLSPEERSVLGLDAPPKPSKPAQGMSISESLASPAKKSA